MNSEDKILFTEKCIGNVGSEMIVSANQENMLHSVATAVAHLVDFAETRVLAKEPLQLIEGCSIGTGQGAKTRQSLSETFNIISIFDSVG